MSLPIHVAVFTFGDYSCDPSEVVSGQIGEGYAKLKHADQSMLKSVSDERIQYRIVDPPNFVCFLITNL